MNINLQQMDYKVASMHLAIEHMCQIDSVWMHSVTAMKWPSTEMACYDREHDFHPNFYCVLEQCDMQDMAVEGLIVPLQLVSILASNQDILVD